jgi:hypothetical protein
VGGGGADGNDARAELDADGHVVVWGEAAFAEADCELEGSVSRSEARITRRLHLIYHSQSPPTTRSSLCSPMAEPYEVVKLHGDAQARRKRAGNDVTKTAKNNEVRYARL